MKITIPICPVTKKNSQQIIMVKGRPMIIPSKRYIDFEKQCRQYLEGCEKPIDFPVNVKCVYFMPTHRKVDLVNLQEATLDVLVKFGVLEDDNSNIVVSMDGSRVMYNKNFPKTVIEITEVEDDTEQSSFELS